MMTNAELAARLRNIAAQLDAGVDVSEIADVRPMTWIEDCGFETHDDYDTAVTSAAVSLPSAPEWAVDETEAGIYIITHRGEIYDAADGDAPSPQWARRLVMA